MPPPPGCLFVSIALKTSPLYIQRAFFGHSSVDGHLGWFHHRTSMNSAGVSMEVPGSLCSADLGSYVYIPRSGRAGPYGNSISSCFNLCADFHSGCLLDIPFSSM